MCGIFAVFLKNDKSNFSAIYGKKGTTLREIAYRQSGKQRHRGPDHTGVVDIPEHGVVIVQERLAILGVETGDQPLQSSDGNVILAANGEIYNYLELTAKLVKTHNKNYVPRSDCDVIIDMYEKHDITLLQHITGMFAFVLYDKKTKNILVARDHIGIIPLFKGEDTEGNLWIASEVKCLVGICEKVECFPPGTVLHGQINDMKEFQYYQPNWIKEIPSIPVDLKVLNQFFESAVRSHLQCEVPFGSLLSGGIDSSIVSSVATKIMRETNPDFRLKTYSVGLEGAPDFKYARMVAKHINSIHKEIIFKIEDGIDCIRDIIYHSESYDLRTVRASIPMVLLSRAIKAEGLKMILSGEGADEIFGGYLYFFYAPTKEDFHLETVKRVLRLQYTDCLRANKSTMMWGLELRVPFLDKEFINHAMSIRPEDKMPAHKNSGRSARMEKHILRAAHGDNYLPEEVIWRQKEQFSDGVGYNWIDTLISYTSSYISDEEFSRASELFPYSTPSTKEEFYYRTVFTEMFPGEAYAETVKRFAPRTDWGCSLEPSGRAQQVHASSNEQKLQ